MANIWLVSLADRETGADQRILVTAPSVDTEDDVRDFVMRPNLTGTKGETITLAHPVVIGVRKLAVKRPPRNTTMAEVTKVPA